MALLQVRNFPDDTYATITEMAKERRRTIAQQAIVLIEKGLAETESQGGRRRDAIARILEREVLPAMRGIDAAALVREDRDR
jgi:hypothetical protein